MGQALYRKYRSKTLADVVGQEHITAALQRALDQQKLSHAYLFTGPRGVGKTSIARILAHAVNGLPYDSSATHLDIIEIDAASNRRIDEIRDLRDKVHLAPTSAQYKVYIIDEVHMLTREAFNALLKTLEEPPAHAIFILATTEVHKLPDTIISRTQQYTFRAISPDKVAAHLRSIASQENIGIDDAALELLAVHGGGSFRDSISLLDQARHSGDALTKADIEAMLGAPNDAQVDALLSAVATHQPAVVITTLQDLQLHGIEAGVLTRVLTNRLRRELIENHTRLSPQAILLLLEQLLNVPSSSEPYTMLEIVLLQHAFSRTESRVVSGAADTVPPSAPSPKNIEKPKAPRKQKPSSQVADAASEAPDLTPPKTVAPTETSGVLDEASWAEVLTHIKKKYNTLYGMLRVADVQFVGDEVTLRFKFAFHQKQVAGQKNRTIVLDTIKQVSGKTATLVCVVDTDVSLKTNTAAAGIAQESSDTSPIGAISNIFGGAELLES